MFPETGWKISGSYAVISVFKHFESKTLSCYDRTRDHQLSYHSNTLDMFSYINFIKKYKNAYNYRANNYTQHNSVILW